MFPKGTPDQEYPTDTKQAGTRLDGRNLVQEWLAKHQVWGVGVGSGVRAHWGKGQSRNY
jgi:hypothetical protein